jgi:UDP-3-O-[3-hydroxymyristoyl] glucosamine N-acyltransferase
VFTLGQLAVAVGGEITGNPDQEIRGVRPFDLARPGDITLVDSPSVLKRVATTAATALIVAEHLDEVDKAQLISGNPKLAFAKLIDLLMGEPFQALGVSPLASIGKDCEIAEDVSIYPFVNVGDRVRISRGVTLHSHVAVGEDCQIGEGSTLNPSVTLYPNVRLGKAVILHSGTVIGADGFGYALEGGRRYKMPQTGTVEIGDEVEIGANSCVDRATFGATVIERGVKIDNLVHVGHNCRIGENTVIVGCVGISGSVEIGRNCVLAGQCGVGDHIRVGDDVTILNKTAVTKDVPSGSVVSGVYGRKHQDELRIQAAMRRLPEIYRDWRERRRELEEKETK